jgi:integrase
MPIKSNTRAHNSAYRRGDYWLDKKPTSPNWYVFRYNSGRGTNDSWSTGTGELNEACTELDRRFLSATDQASSFCEKCGQAVADGDHYPLLQAIIDYKIEHARDKASYVPIKSRLSHINRYCLVALDRDDITCTEASTEAFARGFRGWMQPQPVTWTDKDGNITKSSPRTASAVEESVHQLRAVLNHALNKNRSHARPTFRTKARQTVSKPIWTRASIDQLSDMIGYANETNRRAGLRRFLIASLCTAARPDAIYDMSVNPERFQWHETERFFNLNPFGREQTKKVRPVVPVFGPLADLLADARITSPEGWVVHNFGQHVINVRSAWRTMITDLKLDGGREWGSYVLRRTVATMLRQRGATPWDVQGLMGHRIAGTTETYSFDTLFTSARQGIEDILADIQGKLGEGCFSFSTQSLHSSEIPSPAPSRKILCFSEG